MFLRLSKQNKTKYFVGNGIESQRLYILDTWQMKAFTSLNSYKINIFLLIRYECLIYKIIFIYTNIYENCQQSLKLIVEFEKHDYNALEGV